MGSQYLAKASHRESGVWVQIPAFALTTAHEEIHELFYMQKKHQHFSLFCISQYVLCSCFRETNSFFKKLTTSFTKKICSHFMKLTTSKVSLSTTFSI